LAEELGVPRERIAIPDNSSVIEITAGESVKALPVKAPAELRVVEGHTVSELSDVLMRDRKALGQEGFCVVVATVDIVARGDFTSRPTLSRVGLCIFVTTKI
jgi:mRNA degradation ribonuclease J1/J2